MQLERRHRTTLARTGPESKHSSKVSRVSPSMFKRDFVKAIWSKNRLPTLAAICRIRVPGAL